MDRSIVYPGSIPLDTDLLNTNRDVMIALGALIAATLGTNPVVDGLTVTPTIPATAAVVVAPGSLTQLASIDFAAYGTLPINPAALVKMAIATNAVSLACPAPGLPGQSIAYLIEAAFAEADAQQIVLPYYNAAVPAQPFLGPSGGGTAQPTRRTQQIILQSRAGTPATTGSQTPPAADAGAIGIAIVTVATGQTMVRSGDIAIPPAAPLLQFKLPSLRPGFANVAAFSNTSAPASSGFSVPAGVTRAKVTVIGGGGAGGTHATLPSAGGGSGGVATAWIGGLVPGSVIPVTVGLGGAVAPTPGNGGAGGTSSFGAYVLASGGQGGQGGSGGAIPTGGTPGQGAGGDVATGGAYGKDAIPSANRAGDGADPGGGRGATGAFGGTNALGYGGGGPGLLGGGGGGGLVTVEY